MHIYFSKSGHVFSFNVFLNVKSEQNSINEYQKILCKIICKKTVQKIKNKLIKIRDKKNAPHI